MTTTLPAALSEILEIAQAAATSGDTTRARHYFRNLTELAPELVEGWLGYAACTAVLAERHSLYSRALELEPGHPEALRGREQAAAMLAAGKLVLGAERPSELPSARAAAQPLALVRDERLGLVALTLVGAIVMGALTTFGIFILTSFLGLMLAFMAGPAVSELMLRASRRVGVRPEGWRAQFAVGLGMILGGVGAMAVGGLLLGLAGLPLPLEAVQIARNSGLTTDAATVLLNNPGLLVFVSSAVGSTVFRMR